VSALPLLVPSPTAGAGAGADRVGRAGFEPPAGFGLGLGAGFEISAGFGAGCSTSSTSIKGDGLFFAGPASG
jgi:hypothetical protein